MMRWIIRILQDIDRKWWVGCVLGTEEKTDTTKIMFLHPSGPSPLFTYPTRPVNLQVRRQDIDLCTATGRRYILRAEESDRMKKKHISFHKYIRLLSDY
jgi:hypothetical protein